MNEQNQTGVASETAMTGMDKMKKITMRVLQQLKRFFIYLGKHWVAYLILVIFSITFGYPILWAVLSSFRTSAEIQLNPYGLPSSLQFINYQNAWEAAHMGSYFLNSIFVTFFGLLFLILLAVPTGYVLTRYRFKGRAVLRFIIMAGLFININYIVYPVYLMINDLGIALLGNGLKLTDNLVTVPVILSIASAPFSIYLLMGFLSSLPKGYEEAAKIDGCGHVGTMVRVIVPLAMPSILTVILFQFLSYWNEYMVSQTFLITDTLRTLPVGLLSIMQEARLATDYGRLYAGLTIVMLPVMIVYCFVQGQLTKGMSVGGMKG